MTTNFRLHFFFEILTIWSMHHIKLISSKVQLRLKWNLNVGVITSKNALVHSPTSFTTDFALFDFAMFSARVLNFTFATIEENFSSASSTNFESVQALTINWCKLPRQTSFCSTFLLLLPFSLTPKRKTRTRFFLFQLELNRLLFNWNGIPENQNFFNCLIVID